MRIIWHDAAIYSVDSKPSGLTVMETVGILDHEINNYMVILNPLSREVLTGKPYPRKQPTFYVIPKGMVTDVQQI